MVPSRRPVAESRGALHERSRSALRVAIWLLLAAAPLPFGSVQPWAVLVLELYAVGVGLLALVILAREPLAPKARRMAVPIALLAGVGLAQLVPVGFTPAAALA